VITPLSQTRPDRTITRPGPDTRQRETHNTQQQHQANTVTHGTNTHSKSWNIWTKPG